MNSGELIQRLEVGWTMCDCEPDPSRLAYLERHWLGLLHQYEAACARKVVMRKEVAA